MNAPVLDTLRCAQTLKAAGFTQQQAEGTAQVLGDALAGVATKEDLDATKKDLENAIAQLRTDFGSKIDSMDRLMKFTLGLLGLIFTMITAYGVFDVISTPRTLAATAPVQAEAPLNPPPSEQPTPPTNPPATAEATTPAPKDPTPTTALE